MPLKAGRVAVFIDYQNVYKGARAAFTPDTGNHVDGQVHPRRLGLKLKGVGNDGRELVGVHVYRGLPSSTNDPLGYSAADRQIALWSQQALVTAVTRPLNYRDRSRPREKGIDVKIAVDMVTMAMQGHFDVGVLFSADTDLMPAVEAVQSLLGNDAVEVAAWVPLSGRANRLRRQGGPLWCHMLDQRDYLHVCDSTDYTLRRRRR